MTGRLSEGIRLQRQGKLAEAEAMYRAVLGQTPDDAPALHYMGLVHYQAGRLEARARQARREEPQDHAGRGLHDPFAGDRFDVREYLERSRRREAEAQ